MVPKKDSKKDTSKKNKKNKKDVIKSTKKKGVKQVPRIMKVTLGIIASLFTLISALGRLFAIQFLH